MERHRREGVGLDLVLGELVDVLEPVQRVVLARRVVFPELDLGAEDGGLGGHAVFHPPGGDHDDVAELLVDLQVRVEPDLRVEVVVHVLDAQVAGDPGAVDDERHGNLVESFEPGGALEDVPLFWSHA
jgi:hypothetical protein